jgi:hypothetical protein
MTMWNNKAFTENELIFFGKAALIILVVILHLLFRRQLIRTAFTEL